MNLQNIGKYDHEGLFSVLDKYFLRVPSINCVGKALEKFVRMQVSYLILKTKVSFLGFLKMA